MMGLFPYMCAAQEVEVPEPEFINDAVVVTHDGNVLAMPSESVTISQKENGFKFKRWTLMEVDGKTSALRLAKGEPIEIIINAGVNHINPMQLIRIVKFDAKKKKREHKFGEESTAKAAFGLTVTGKSDASFSIKNEVPFTAKKFGEHSYRISIPSIEHGEYGILIDGALSTGQSNLDALIVTTFGVDK